MCLILQTLGLALVAAAMANKGSVNSNTVISESAWEALHDAPTEDCYLADLTSNFTQGGVNKFEEADTAGRNGYYGWLGYGGSVFQWHPDLKIGFAYVPTLLDWYTVENRKGRLLQGEIVKCVEKLQNGKSL